MTRLLALVLWFPVALQAVEVETLQAPDAVQVVEGEERAFVESDDYVLRLSLPTEADIELWQKPGIRVTLGWIQGAQWSLGPAPDVSPLGAALRPWLRISPDWSLGATFSWQAIPSGLTGLKWSATLEPTWHVARGFALSIGLGYGGLMATRPWEELDETPVEKRPDRSVSHTLPDDQVLPECSSGGWTALLRAEYQFVVGPLFSTGPFVQGDVLRVGCESNVGDDVETGRPVVLRQWWMYAGFNLGWWATWR